MSKVFKTLTLMFILVLTLTMTACKKDDNSTADLLEEAKTTLMLSENLSNIVDNLSLPTTGKNDSTIAWSSDKPEVVANDGAVTRPLYGEGNEVVILTATITVGDETTTKEFRLRVLEAPERIGITVEGVLGQDPDTEITLENVIVLGVTTEGYYVGDETGNIFIFTQSTPPSNVKVGDKVNLLGTYVLYYGQPEVEDPNSYEIISSNNTLPTPDEMEIEDITNDEYLETKTNYARLIQVKGFVTTEDDSTFITDNDGNKLEINYKSDEDAVKAFLGKKVKIDVLFHTYRTDLETYRVSYAGGTLEEAVMTPAEKLDAAKGAISLPYGTINDLELPTEDSTGDVEISWSSANTAVIANDGTITRGASSVSVKLTATLTTLDTDGVTELTATFSKTVTVVGTDTTDINTVLGAKKYEWFTVEGIVFGAQDGGYFIYDGTESIFVYANNDVTIGDTVKLVGQLDVYNNQPQLSGVLEFNYTFNTTYNLPVATDVTIVDINKYDEKTKNVYADYVVINGFVKVEGEHDNAYIYDIVSGEKVEVYYKSNQDLVKDFEGKFVTVKAVLYRMNHDQYDQWTVSVVNNSIVEKEVSDADVLAAAKGLLELDAQVVADITLPTTDLTGRVSISWESNNAAITKDGKVTLPASGNVDIVLTASLSIGEETDEEKDLNVQVMAPSTVADAIAQEDGNIVAIKAIVSGLNGKYGYFIQDTDGTAIYVNKMHEVEIGDEIIIVGALETYTNYDNNQTRLKSNDKLRLLDIVSSDNDVTVKSDVAIADIATELSTYSSQLIKLTNVTVDVVDDGFDYLHITTGEDMNLKFKPSDFDIETIDWNDGDTIAEITFNVYDVSFSDIRVVNVTLKK